MLVTLVEAAKILGRLSVITDNPKREANWLWERLNRVQKRRQAGLPDDPNDPYTTFPAMKDGRVWMVHRERLAEWAEKHFGGKRKAA